MTTWIEPGMRITRWIGDPTHSRNSSIGTGYRRFLICEVGTKWVTALYLPSLTKMEWLIADIERDRSVTVVPVEAADRKRLKRLIRATKNERDALGLPYSERLATLALGLLARPPRGRHPAGPAAPRRET